MPGLGNSLPLWRLPAPRCLRSVPRLPGCEIPDRECVHEAHRPITTVFIGPSIFGSPSRREVTAMLVARRSRPGLFAVARMRRHLVAAVGLNGRAWPPPSSAIQKTSAAVAATMQVAASVRLRRRRRVSDGRRSSRRRARPSSSSPSVSTSGHGDTALLTCLSDHRPETLADGLMVD